MQGRHSETLGGRLVCNFKRAEPSARRVGQTRIPLRPHSSGACANRLGKRRGSHKRRKASTIPLRTKKAPELKHQLRTTMVYLAVLALILGRISFCIWKRPKVVILNFSSTVLIAISLLTSSPRRVPVIFASFPSFA
jgi:hypothetical protein